MLCLSVLVVPGPIMSSKQAVASHHSASSNRLLVPGMALVVEEEVVAWGNPPWQAPVRALKEY